MLNKFLKEHAPCSAHKIMRLTFGEARALCDKPNYNKWELNKWFRRFYHAFLIIINKAVAVQFNKEEFPK